jgi:hypothetical protein
VTVDRKKALRTALPVSLAVPAMFQLTEHVDASFVLKALHSAVDSSGVLDAFTTTRHSSSFRIAGKQTNKVQVQVNLGGGVWKFKWNPDVSSVALVACMQNGFSIVALDDNGCLTRVLEYPHQKVLGYGADWCRINSSVVATCSFYDKSLHLWKVALEAFLPAG